MLPFIPLSKPSTQAHVPPTSTARQLLFQHLIQTHVSMPGSWVLWCRVVLTCLIRQVWFIAHEKNREKKEIRHDWLLPSLDILFSLWMSLHKLSHVFCRGQNQWQKPPLTDQVVCSAAKGGRTGSWLRPGVCKLFSFPMGARSDNVKRLTSV